MPVTPQNEAGWRIDPPVSVPVLAGISRAATATALAPDEPPGIWAVFQGLRTGTGCAWPSGAMAEFSFDEPMANSSQLSLPRVTAPASARRRTTVASKGER